MAPTKWLELIGRGITVPLPSGMNVHSPRMQHMSLRSGGTAAYRGPSNVNRQVVETSSPILSTFKLLVDHYRERKMRMDNHDKKAYSTKKRNESYLGKWIVPRWGEHRPSDIKSVAVEEWLESLSKDTGKRKGQPLGAAPKSRSAIS